MHHEARAPDLLTALCSSEPAVLLASLCTALPEPTEKGPPEWIQLLPLGPEVRGRDGRRWTLDEPEAVIAAFNAEGMDLPLDWEHATELKAPKGELAPAAGFIKSVELVRTAANGRTPGIWGRVDWSEGGAQSVQSKAYRFVSPVFRHTKAGSIRSIQSAGLTNRPNLDLFALNQRSADKENTVNEEQLKALRVKLGLPAEASAEQVMTALNTRLGEPAKTNLDNMVPKTELEAAMNRANAAEAELDKARKTEHAREVDAFLEQGKREGKITPASVEQYKAMCSTAEGFAATKALVATLPAIVTPGAQGQGGAPASAADPGAVTLTAEEKSRCQMLGVSEDIYLSVKREDDLARKGD